jgi:hypothetical protein
VQCGGECGVDLEPRGRCAAGRLVRRVLDAQQARPDDADRADGIRPAIAQRALSGSARVTP